MLSGCKIGLGITGSFCTFDKILSQIKFLKDEGAEVTPVFSFNTQNMNTRFYAANDFINNVESITGNKGIYTIQQAEQVGPKKLFDIMVIAPCTGNTLAKLTNGITDTPVLMASKAHLRNERPLLIAISTNDGLGMNFQNIGRIMNTKNIYFVPFGQDDCIKKPNSLVAYLDKLKPSILSSLNGKQIEPVIY
ncbi:MAG: dipicolinate synthase subunit B [Lachnospiraceae bacterium]|nr:dipicolinate synthase subunit B [Lachnospiraceae bacterium]